MISAHLRACEPRRAHVWMQDLREKGCAQWPSYEPEVVRPRGRELLYRRHVEEHLELVIKLTKALAMRQNTAREPDFKPFSPGFQRFSALFGPLEARSRLDLGPLESRS